MEAKTKGRLVLGVIYLIAFTLGYFVSIASDYPVLVKATVFVALAVITIYMGSLDFNNSSVFDPYWSVAPPIMVIYFWLAPAPFDDWHHQPRILILLILTLAYGIRLTWNFLRGWPGLEHEDWRYVDFRNRSGKAYWIVSFFGIHGFPALVVFGGTLSIWVVVIYGYRPMNLLDIIAFLVTGNAILLEAISDKQLRNFVNEPGTTGMTMNKGLWSLSRHPNYLGEMLFWWGLYLFALAANPAFWWVIIGPSVITLMFVCISIPMIEKRMMTRKKDYAEYCKKVPVLIPFPQKNRL